MSPDPYRGDIIKQFNNECVLITFLSFVYSPQVFLLKDTDLGLIESLNDI